MDVIKHTDPNVIEKTIKALEDGGLVIYPTETCYGLGVDATNQKAVKKMLLYKSRREGKPISVAVADQQMASKYTEINEIAANLYQNYLPGPITVVTKGLHNLAEGVESEYGTLGIRIPDYTLILELLKQYNKPITSTSANVSYQKRPYSIKELLKDLPVKQKNLIDLIIDAGTLPPNDVSTVIDTTLNTLNVIREGQVEFDKQGKTVLEACTKSTEETISFGSMTILKFLNTLKDSCIIFALGGELGTGKTQFTKGIAKQLKINRTIKSPTFNLINEYEYKLDTLSGQLVHIDTWRLKDEKELDRLEITNYITPGNVLSIEWADKFFGNIQKFIKSKELNIKPLILKVKLEHLAEKECFRKITVEKL